PARLQSAPEIPTASEAGLPGMELQVFNGLFTPMKTPAPIIEKIANATKKALEDQEFQRRLRESGFEPVAPNDPDAARRYVENEANRLIPVIRSVGFKLD